ncbi:MAG: helix-turn-helix domain-containing protein [Candidatus Dormibacteria bacterium]
MRYRFGPAFGHAVRLRGLDLGTLAAEAGVSPSTASSAVRGRSLNLRTAIRIARAVAGSPVIPELESWSAEPLEVPDRDAALG